MERLDDAGIDRLRKWLRAGSIGFWVCGAMGTVCADYSYELAGTEGEYFYAKKHGSRTEYQCDGQVLVDDASFCS